MKYVLLFVETGRFSASLEAMTPDDRARGFARVDAWMAEHRDVIRGGAKLQGAQRAADERALRLSRNPAEQAILHERLSWT
jgi:hypothetical protein